MQTQRLQKLAKLPGLNKRALALLIGVTGLLLVYFNQQFSYLGALNIIPHPYVEFIANKTIRYILNDNCCLLLIYAFFYKRSYVMMGFYLELLGLLVLLPLYFLLKLSIEGDAEISSPLFSFFHRLIINPTLMILLIVGMFYQQRMGGHK